MRLQRRGPRPLAYPVGLYFEPSFPARDLAQPGPIHPSAAACHPTEVLAATAAPHRWLCGLFWGGCAGRNVSSGYGALQRGSFSRELRGDARLGAGPLSGRAWLFLLPRAAGVGGGKGKSCFCHLSRESLLHKDVGDIWKKRRTSTQSCARRTRGAALMFFLNSSTFKRGQFRYILICYTVLN